MSKLKKFSEWLISIFVILVFIISAIALISVINGKKTGVNSVFGKVINTVQSDSMEDTLMKGDVIVGTVFKGQSLDVGDIITFKQIVNNRYIFNTHRIISKDTVGDTTVYETKGDNELGIDSGYRLESDIVATYDFRIPYVGGFIDWVKEPLGFIICIILPIVAVILYEIYNIVSIILKSRDEHFVAQSAKDTSEDVKAEIIKEYLAAQEAAKKDKTEE